MIALCEYILQGGNRCGQAALKDDHYCRHHRIVNMATAEATSQGHGMRDPLPFVFPEDCASVQINYYLLAQGINDGHLDLKTANILLRVFKACDANLKKGPLNACIHPDSATSAQEVDEMIGEDCAPSQDTSSSENPAQQERASRELRAAPCSLRFATRPATQHTVSTSETNERVRQDFLKKARSRW